MTRVVIWSYSGLVDVEKNEETTAATHVDCLAVRVLTDMSVGS